MPPEKFAVSNTLSEDGRVGKVVDVQGVVSVKPMNYGRWTPVRPNVLLMPGDWVRADVRGANAATLRLLPQAARDRRPRRPGRGGQADAGPPARGRGRDRSGEGHAHRTARPRRSEGDRQGARLLPRHERATGRGEGADVAEGVQGRDRQRVDRLAGGEGGRPQRAADGRLPQGDGRDPRPDRPDHHRGDVRQPHRRAARRACSTSRCRRTPPSPGSACGSATSWSRRTWSRSSAPGRSTRRSCARSATPGLLEWTGGNIFKARVWPIFAHSEKRIQITYTQVLPLKGNRYRYSYALQSEMLKQNPLKELSIDVRVHSAVPLKSVASPTHTCRVAEGASTRPTWSSRPRSTRRRGTSRRWSRSPSRPPVVAVVPHRRGEDGYFLVPGDAAGRAGRRRAT